MGPHYTEAKRLMVGLPVRDGGLALLDVRKTVTSQYEASTEATAVLQSLILDQVGAVDDRQREAYTSHFVRVAAAKRQQRRGETKAAKGVWRMASSTPSCRHDC